MLRQERPLSDQPVCELRVLVTHAIWDDKAVKQRLLLDSVCVYLLEACQVLERLVHDRAALRAYDVLYVDVAAEELVLHDVELIELVELCCEL